MCVKCFDCEASVIGGVCSCGFEGAIWDSLGFCSTAEEEEEAVAEKKARVRMQASAGCPAECEQCENEKCKECKKGYYLGDKSCMKCRPECKSCSTEGTCEECKEGFFLGKERECEQERMLNCAKSEGRKCTQCLEGFELVGDACQNNGKIKQHRYPTF